MLLRSQYTSIEGTQGSRDGLCSSLSDALTRGKFQRRRGLKWSSRPEDLRQKNMPISDLSFPLIRLELLS